MPVRLAEGAAGVLEGIRFWRLGFQTKDEVGKFRLELLEALERRVSVALKLQYSKRKA